MCKCKDPVDEKFIVVNDQEEEAAVCSNKDSVEREIKDMLDRTNCDVDDIRVFKGHEVKFRLRFELDED